MTVKKQKRPPPRTATPGYFFGAQKAADAQHKRKGTTRAPAKLPTSLRELRESIDGMIASVDDGRSCAARRDALGYRCAHCRASWVGRTEPPPCVRVKT